MTEVVDLETLQNRAAAHAIRKYDGPETRNKICKRCRTFMKTRRQTLNEYPDSEYDSTEEDRKRLEVFGENGLENEIEAAGVTGGSDQKISQLFS
ncbi:hypothetical protein O9G_005608 [Rozella allomycis CSF55]|uniref:Uncharacterized protein n=1 Tax=Rozella allomycis (strain CSF55) TaxID=988480 RepID=A0A075AU52_ROZAC|nr:hypothetical protein O9G_005608 [Rozella allomycis CSF55]|eukprot:EPZ33831.1 hypothetical protein O9G_005608 [Rozella allomycis CSF55]